MAGGAEAGDAGEAQAPERVSALRRRIAQTRPFAPARDLQQSLETVTF